MTERNHSHEQPATQEKQRSLDPWGLLSAALFIVAMMTLGGFFGRFWWAARPRVRAPTSICGVQSDRRGTLRPWADASATPPQRCSLSQ